MNARIVFLIHWFVFALYSASAQAGNCFAPAWTDAQPTLTATIEIADGPYSYTSNRCAKEAYYDGHGGITAANCAANQATLTLDKGYTPFGVMFEGDHSTPRLMAGGTTGIKAYRWRISPDEPAVAATALVAGQKYVIAVPGTTNFTLIGAANSTAGTSFTATGPGIGTGTATKLLREYDSFNAGAVLENNEAAVIAGSFVVGKTYTIQTANDTNFTLIGAANNLPGTVFTATGAGSGTGTAVPDKTFTAELVVTHTNNTTATATKTVTVWPRTAKPTYYVDSAIGDDRFSGTSQTVVGGCDQTQSANYGVCAGPWKTATRAFNSLSPRNVTTKDAHLDAMDMCAISASGSFRQYSAGVFITYRSRTDYVANMVKDRNGDPLPAVTMPYCVTSNPPQNSTLTAGSQILFKAGQTFDLETSLATAPTTTTNGLQYQQLTREELFQTKVPPGILLGKYNSGAKPVIKYNGSIPGIALTFTLGLFHFSMQDLEFNLESQVYYPFNTRVDRGNKAVLVFGNGWQINTVMNRVDVKNMEQGIILNGNTLATGGQPDQGDGFFLFDSTFYNSNVTQFFVDNAYRHVSIVNGIFEKSSNHIFYTSMAYSQVYGNTFRHPAFGRTAFRLAGSVLYAGGDRSVWIGHNNFVGWVDPRTFTLNGGEFTQDVPRYNAYLLNISPNVANSGTLMHVNSDVVFDSNTVSNYEVALNVGNADNLIISKNTFTTPDGYNFNGQIVLSSSYSRRPARKIEVKENSFTQSASTTSYGMFLQLDNYNSDVCDDAADHSGIYVRTNQLTSPNDKKPFAFTPITPLTMAAAEAKLPTILTFTGNTFTSPIATASRRPLMIGCDSSLGSTSPVSCTNANPYCEYVTSLGAACRLYAPGSPLYNTIMSTTTNN